MSATVATSKLETLRAQMPALQATGYFNAGTFGPMPNVGVEAAQALLAVRPRTRAYRSRWL